MTTLYVDNIAPNLQSKISAPDIQLPSGSVIQYQYRYQANAGFSTSTTGTYLDVPNFYVDITPKFSDSTLIFRTSLISGTSSSSTYAIYRVVDSNDSDAVFNSNQNVSASGYLGTNWQDDFIVAVNTAGTTNTMRLQLQVQVNGTYDAGWSGGTSKVIEVMEIAG